MATYNNYPQSAVNNAKKALKYRDENGTGCGTRVGWVRANQIAQRENLSDDTVKRVYSFLSRAAVYNTGSYMDEDGNEVCGTIMYDAWGGASMLRWAEPIAKRLREANNMKEISIENEIGGYAANYMREELRMAGGDSVTLRISSPGGSVLEGFAIMDALAAYTGEVTTFGVGYVASIASVILLAGDRVKMAENAFLMVHNPWSYMEGDAEDMRKQADILEKMEMQIADVYAQSIAKRKGKSYKSALALALQYMEAETWFTAEEALKAGFIDEVVSKEDYKKETFTALARFDRVPEALILNYSIDTTMKNSKTMLERFLAVFNEETEQEATTAQGSDPVADARKTLEEAGYMVLEPDAKAEYDELVKADEQLEAVLAKAEAEIMALRTENKSLKAQAKATAGAPSGGSDKDEKPQTRKAGWQEREKVFSAFASLLKDNR